MLAYIYPLHGYDVTGGFGCCVHKCGCFSGYDYIIYTRIWIELSNFQQKIKDSKLHKPWPNQYGETVSKRQAFCEKKIFPYEGGPLSDSFENKFDLKNQ